ncbi:MAG: glucose 1-dehydrogenase [Rhizobiales bacterium]|nr:glucose 1-dehydrogenase [Hyphomicrobiales bacterium]
MRLLGKTAIVTGASSGIGRGIALRFASEGAAVIVADIHDAPREGGEPTQREIESAGGTAIAIPCNVAVWADVDRLVSTAVARFGRLDIMVNNAAVVGHRKLCDTSEQEWDAIFDINAKGVFMCCKRAVQQMLMQTPVGDARGRIINIGSQHGIVAAPGKFAYGASKAAALYIARQIAVDYAKEGIICNAVAPGRILTTGLPGETDNDPHDYSVMRTPMPRLGRPADVAAAALYLASDEAGFVTGHTLMVDGGWMAF